MQTEQPILDTLVTACHILHHHGVTDAFGHISVRNDSNPLTFFISRKKAPALISAASDFVECHIKDATPVDRNDALQIPERYIHSELFKRFKGVNSVVHSHAPALLPYTISGVPLRPVINSAGFLGTDVPVFDLPSSYLSYPANSETHDLLISSAQLGADLAAKFTSSQNAASKLYSAAFSMYKSLRDQSIVPQDHPDNTVVLMRGHGFTTAAASIQQAVYQAIYTQTNAQIQTSSMMLRTAYMTATHIPAKERKDEKPIDTTGIQYLSAQEASAARLTNERIVARSWDVWAKEVESAGSLYQ